jgi:hypothetical protein
VPKILLPELPKSNFAWCRIVVRLDVATVPEQEGFLAEFILRLAEGLEMTSGRELSSRTNREIFPKRPLLDAASKRRRRAAKVMPGDFAKYDQPFICS